MNSSEVRQSFLDFFLRHGHKIVKSSSLLPDTPNLLFTNAGMNQFVPIFLGQTRPFCSRVADTQKCIRAGGKHNDLDDVGFDTYHHTFFEMLGNWSFGDYFKKEAIQMAWELLTEVWKFPKDRLYATIYSPKPNEPSSFDKEAYDIWEKIFSKEGIDPDVHIIEGSKADNFWMMGDTGPCGPCSEIHMDLTPNGDTGGNLVNAGNPWCIELWNLVFIQFNATANGTFENLKDKHIDTGIGFERIVGILAKTKNFSDFSQLPSNYDSDLFADIFSETEKMCGQKYHGTVPTSRTNMSPDERCDFWFRAIADHVRTLTFAIADGIFPSNEGRGYVLRRILRRAVMFGKLLKLPHGFFSKLSSVVIDKMGTIFEELIEQKSTIGKVLENEEQSFSKTIDRGVTIFHEICEKSGNKIAGDDAFLLYDTYGFPLDLTQLMAAERKISIDIDGFECAMEKQRTLARSAQKKSIIEVSNNTAPQTEFIGYNIDNIENIQVVVLDIINDGGKTFLIFDKTPFYAECGGQVGDRGIIQCGLRTFHVVDVQKDKNGCYVHELQEQTNIISLGQKVILSVDRSLRRSITRNHSATHILHFALRQVLGKHIKQAGSSVDDKRLRFDFNALAAPTEEELKEIEKLVEEKILECVDSNIFETDKDHVPAGCIANFGEKYGEIVRVVEFGDFSRELCGGCHVNNTSEIACFKIISTSAIAAGIRRIEAVTGQAAFDLFRTSAAIINRQCKTFSCQPSELLDKIDALINHSKELEKTVKVARQTFLQNMASELVQSSPPSNGKIIRIEKDIDNLQPDELRILALDILHKIEDGVVILTSCVNGKCSVVTCCSKTAITAGFNASNIVKELTSKHGGSGGGRAEFAMGGYDQPR
ncbi:MAG: alanine--tRNA ligase [Puniceicoccales bacterium]|jgi:alanyl-tRNA synthetase|nr:alanine--tRNA ligase [Puniceicoccales bacterium]